MLNTIIEGNNIFQTGIYGDKECIGVITSAYLELKKELEFSVQKVEEFFNAKEEYLQRLIDAGLETRPRTQEEINAELLVKIKEQEEINKQLMEAVLTLNKKLDSEVVKNESTDTSTDGSKVRNTPTKAKPSGANG